MPRRAYAAFELQDLHEVRSLQKDTKMTQHMIEGIPGTLSKMAVPYRKGLLTATPYVAANSFRTDQFAGNCIPDQHFAEH